MKVESKRGWTDNDGRLLNLALRSNDLPKQNLSFAKSGGLMTKKIMKARVGGEMLNSFLIQAAEQTQKRVNVIQKDTVCDSQVDPEEKVCVAWANIIDYEAQKCIYCGGPQP